LCFEVCGGSLFDFGRLSARWVSVCVFVLCSFSAMLLPSLLSVLSVLSALSVMALRVKDAVFAFASFRPFSPPSDLSPFDAFRFTS